MLARGGCKRGRATAARGRLRHGKIRCGHAAGTARCKGVEDPDRKAPEDRGGDLDRRRRRRGLRAFVARARGTLGWRLGGAGGGGAAPGGCGAGPPPGGGGARREKKRGGSGGRGEGRRA